jgi:hypothetical protein
MSNVFDFKNEKIGDKYHFILKVNKDLFDGWEHTDPYTYIRDQFAIGAEFDVISAKTEDNIRIYKGVWSGKTRYNNK